MITFDYYYQHNIYAIIVYIKNVKDENENGCDSKIREHGLGILLPQDQSTNKIYLVVDSKKYKCI